MMKKDLLIIGSTNIDLVVYSDTFPKKGETLTGTHFQQFFGGKGANQAVAAAKMGSQVTFVSCVGNDIHGESALQHLQENHIDTRFVAVDKQVPTGVAMINIGDGGDNKIIVVPGANGVLKPAHLGAVVEKMADYEYIVMQLEVPMETIAFMADVAGRYQKKLILNPAPAQPLSDQVLANCYMLTPNETEAEAICGLPVTDAQSAGKAAQQIRAKGVEVVIITLGENGVFVSCESFEGMVPCPKVTAVDTTAAGDTFTGALTAFLNEGIALENAVVLANKAASIAVTRAGAQASIPLRSEVV
ncbi:ribokinase [Persicobacter psychrovividus]|uniref:Ribokinase n=1 Tax=Persicobacter psychrovividus TaxID=387638 RepID=A0ABM7VIN6_9BACT|nr:ribokinase [Persicobacter psychrovividus]